MEFALELGSAAESAVISVPLLIHRGVFLTWMWGC